MFDPNHNASPVNSIPPAVLVLVGAIAAIEAIFQLGAIGVIGGASGIGLRSTMVERFGFFDPVFEWMRRSGTWPPAELLRFVTYGFFHYAAMHAIFAGVLLLAIGKFVAERYSGIAVVAIFLVSTIVGALGYGLVLNENQLIGAYPGVYGLMGAFTYYLLVKYEAEGENRLKAFQLIGFLVAIQLFFKIAFGGANDWVADLFGFAAGFALSVVLAPGGLAKLMDKARRN